MGLGLGVMAPAMLADYLKNASSAPAASEVSPCPACQQAVPRSARFCAHCGQELIIYNRCPHCSANLAPHARFSLLDELARDENETRLGHTEFAQPAIFAMQIALAELWKSWGVEPSCIVGHSVGEVAATCLAGIFTLEEAAEIIVVRAHSEMRDFRK